MAEKIPTGALIVEPGKTPDSPIYWAVKWRSALDGRQRKLRIGKAWLEPRPEALEGAQGWQRGYRKRKGKARVGYMTPDEAAAKLRPTILRATEAEHRDESRGPVKFEDAAAAWLAHQEKVKGNKPSTLRDYRSMLHDEEREPKPKGRKPQARVMKKWWGKSVTSITSAQVAAWLRELDNDPRLTARSVNKHRQVMGQILGYCVVRGWIEENPVTDTDKRRQADAAEIIVYSPEQVELIARHAADEQLRAMIQTAAYSGLRLGELLALRWRDVDFENRRIRVTRNYSQGLGITTPKSRKPRSVPLADQVAKALDGLSKRNKFTGPDDLVFCNASGHHRDPTSTRRSYYKARGKAREDDPSMLVLTFHQLRHCFGTRSVSAGIDLLTVKEWMGHRDIKTTMAYLHYREAADDADKLTRALGNAVPDAAELQAA